MVIWGILGYSFIILITNCLSVFMIYGFVGDEIERSYTFIPAFSFTLQTYVNTISLYLPHSS